MQSSSGKGPPLPNQSTYLIHLSQGPWASLARFGTRQEGIRRVVAGEMERWREERAVEGKEIRGEEMMEELILDHEILPFRSMTHIDKCLQMQMVPVFL